jgi:phosphatidate phosphatase APP1
MASYNDYGRYGTGYDSQLRVPGARREKLKGYLRAANELRQTYQETIQRNWQGEEESARSGNFPDVDIVRSGHEELLLFPSYARKHVKRKPQSNQQYVPRSGDPVPGSRNGIEDPHSGQEPGLVSSGDADYWKRQWEIYEDANAIVDVDVRGWIYSPQKGPLNRRNRLLLAVARRLSGIPAPQEDDGWASSRNASPRDSPRLAPAGEANKHEEMAAAKEAENIARRGQKEADNAAKGSYTLGTGGTASANTSRSNSPTGLRRQLTGTSTDSEFGAEDGDPAARAISKRSSWNQPYNMSREELLQANELLMSRLRPFMTMPLTNTTITVFFFNDKKSSSKSVTTNESGHFNVRAALDFVPTQVRVLASENLSATEDVHITDSDGVSLISDIDDTIKHSAIASGAREIFKNTFIRELGDLTIKGVREWYTAVANMGVKMHYVSNSPWQLYPLLKSYFALAGLPNGSFHLKQYSGMLQGIFEPAAERKRGSLDRIMDDFPDRKFILVGDSGEADLEVYTDVVLSHPGRILAVFIRDVTTPVKKGFFESNAPPSPRMASNGSHHDRDTSDDTAQRPALPSRPKTTVDTSVPHEEPDLIDFSEDPEPMSLDDTRRRSYTSDLRSLETTNLPPTKPSKPSNLRNFSTQSPTPPTNHDRIDSPGPDSAKDGKPKVPPPKPRRSSQAVAMSPNKAPPTTSQSPASTSAPRRPPMERISSASSIKQRPPVSRTASSSSFRSNYSTNQEEGYVAAARRGLTTAYNALPQIRASPTLRPTDGSAPPVPPRRGLTSYPAAAARWATGATGGDPAAGGDGGLPGTPYNKKEEMWKRRWARAEEIMRSKGIVLRSWRVGSDVMSECVRIVEKAQRELLERDGKSR